MKRLFLIAVGGTGAKVAEAFIHLCAAGVGPDEADILLIDVDQTNGNRIRAQEALERYEKLQIWNWEVPGAARSVFHTKLRVHVLISALSLNHKGGLQSQAVTPNSMRPALDLFYDDMEQTYNCEEGFQARPNLGSLVMAGHLAEKLCAPENSNNNEAPKFIQSLKVAVGQTQADQRVPIAIAGSIFGGTGASAFPIIAGCLQQAMEEGNNPDMRRKRAEQQMARMELSAVMLLPYFTTEGTNPDGSITVDSTRFLSDTSNALKYYSETHALDGFKRVYLVGSENTGRYVLKYITGARGQANPPMIEEVMAALAILHLGEPPSGADSVYVYPPFPADSEDKALSWEALPWIASDKQSSVTAMRALLHLAAFYLYAGQKSQPIGRGIDAAALEEWQKRPDEVIHFPWYDQTLREWAERHETYRRASTLPEWKRLYDPNILPPGHSASEATPVLREYFARLVWWANFAFGAGADELDLLQWDDKTDSLIYWEAMCTKGAPPLEPIPDGKKVIDNALVRILRTAAVGIHKVLDGSRQRNRSFVLSARNGANAPQGLHCRLPPAHRREDLNKVEEAYRGTAHELQSNQA